MVHAKVSLLSTKLFKHITEREVRGKIHSQFENAINIELEDGYLFNILPETIPPNSRSVILPFREWHHIQKPFLSVGLPVYIREYHLEIPTLAISISFGRSRLWDPAPSFRGSPMSSIEIRRNLEIVSTLIAQNAKNGSPTENPMIEPHRIFEIIPYEALSEASGKAFRNRICRATKDLFFSISTRDLQGISKASSQLIGLGPGLTPSGDDVLAGVMAAGVYFGLAYDGLTSEVERINSRIISKVPGRTTIHSQILLSDANRGEVVRPLAQLLQGILCGDEVTSLVSLTRQVMALGESSGKDTLVGVLIGLEAFMRLEQRVNST